MRSLPAPLAGLAAYHAPLSTLQREQGGAVTLLTPGVNVLALNVTYLPTGFFLTYQAWRSNISGIVGGPTPSFFGVKKA